MKINPIGHLVKTNPNKAKNKPCPELGRMGQFKPYPELAEALPALRSFREGGSAAEWVVEWVEWANFRQEIPKMPYLLAYINRHYVGTVKAMQAGTCFSGLIFLLIL